MVRARRPFVNTKFGKDWLVILLKKILILTAYEMQILKNIKFNNNKHKDIHPLVKLVL